MRTVTQTVSDTVIEVDNQMIHFFDVSGLKHHRKQWVSYFEDVLMIVFVVDLSSYDKMMLEDPTVNRMADAMNLFDQIVNHELLKRPDMMLFFNKKDIFEKKVAKSPLSIPFPEYKGNYIVYYSQVGSHML